MTKGDASPTPLLRVSRPVSACQRCRSAKIKCDGKLPACTACDRAGRGEECSSANDQFAKGKERNYVASLENRVEKLERQIAQAKCRQPPVGMLERTAPSASLEARVPAGNRKAKIQEASNVDDLVSDFGFLSVNATARDFHGFTKEMSFARLVLSTSSLEQMPEYSNFSLPQRYEIAPLIQHYLDTMHTMYPFLPEARLFASIDAVFSQDGRYAGPMDHWIAMMVLAVSLASLAHSREDPRHRDALRYAAAAFKHIELVVEPGSVSGVQAILLMVLFAMWVPRQFNSWYLIGVASRALVDLGLHHGSPSEMRQRHEDIVTRLRVYDCVYALDRSISMVHHRSFSFTDDSTNVARIYEVLKHSMSQSPFLRGLDPALQLMKLRRIQSAYYQKLFQAERLEPQISWPIMCESVRDMVQFYSSLPTQMDESLRNYLHCEVLYSSILMLTPPRWIQNLPDYGKVLIFQHAEQYADLMHSATSSEREYGFNASHDLLRVSFVAERFVTLVKGCHVLVTSGLASSPLPPALETVKPPAIISRFDSKDSPVVHFSGIADQTDTIHDCLERFESTIGYFCSRYGYRDPLYEFQVISGTLKEMMQSLARDQAQKSNHYSWPASGIIQE